MQNNVKLLAVRYLPGLVLLGGTGKKGGPRRCWCQDLHLRLGKEGRMVLVSILGLSVTPGLGFVSSYHCCSGPSSLVLAGRCCTALLAAGRMMWSVSPCLSAAPSLSLSTASHSVPDTPSHHRCGAAATPPVSTWKVVLGTWPYKHGLFSSLNAWLV